MSTVVLKIRGLPVISVLATPVLSPTLMAGEQAVNAKPSSAVPNILSAPSGSTALAKSGSWAKRLLPADIFGKLLTYELDTCCNIE